MGKRRGKKLKEKAQTVVLQRAKEVTKKKKKKVLSNLAMTITSDPAGASGSTSVIDSSTDASQRQKKEEKNPNHLSGFIFLCSGRTKPECYQYRVFGLPKQKLEVVEKIKAGTKLFLFDFNLKLLYGVYEATSAGKMNLEPSAFGGNFPAQVKFRIFKECLPLPEKSFKQTIKDNYEGTKFKPELSKRQVRDLISLFCPLGAPSSVPVSVPSTVPNTVPRQTLYGDPYVAGAQFLRAPPTRDSRHIQNLRPLQPQQPEPVAYLSQIRSVKHRNQPEPSNAYNYPGSQQSYFSQSIAHGMTSVECQSFRAPAEQYIIPDSQQPYFTGRLAHGMTPMEHRRVPAPSGTFYVQDALPRGTTAIEHQSLSAPSVPRGVHFSQPTYLTDALAHGMTATEHRSLPPPSGTYYVQDYKQRYSGNGLTIATNATEHPSLLAHKDPYITQDPRQVYISDERHTHGMTTTEHQSLPTPSDPYTVPDSQQYFTKGLPLVRQEEPYSRDGRVQGVIPHSQSISSGTEYQRLPQQENEVVLHRDRVVPYNPNQYNSYNSYPYNYYSTPEAPYGTPGVQPQAPALASRMVEAYTPVSSYYSFDGATRTTS